MSVGKGAPVEKGLAKLAGDDSSVLVSPLAVSFNKSFNAEFFVKFCGLMKAIDKKKGK